MQKSLKHVKSIIRSVEFAKEKFTYIEQDFIAIQGKKAYDGVINHYDSMIAKLKKEAAALPIGFRYTGVFYLKNPSRYDMISKAEKITGSLYMREDLVSWNIETDHSRNISHYKIIFKDFDMQIKITREDAEPVFAPKNN